MAAAIEGETVEVFHSTTARKYQLKLDARVLPTVTRSPEPIHIQKRRLVRMFSGGHVQSRTDLNSESEDTKGNY
jgi:hypothetical protein